MIDLYKLALIACDNFFRPLVPRDTGNMAEPATKVEKVSDTEVKIYVDPNIAPYVPYTNEPWTSPKWKGKENPNEKWFQRAAERTAYNICALLGGTIQPEGEEQ